MKRIIKFRAWDKERKIYIKPENLIGLCGETTKELSEMSPYLILEQFTGLKDKSGKDIYEGDKIRIRTPQRDTQTHEGDNIPLGSYTEPMEPIIYTSEYVVVFNNGSFCLEDKDSINFNTGEDVSYSPLAYEIIEYDLDFAKEMFEGGYFNYSAKSNPYRSNVIDWDNEDDGDLQYLLETYNLKDELELLNYLGLEIIGNIHDKQ